MNTQTLDHQFIFDTQQVFSDWSLTDDLPQFTAEDRDAIARSFAAFRNGDFYSLDEADQITVECLQTLYTKI